jgi:hypothetical protein
MEGSSASQDPSFDQFGRQLTGGPRHAGPAPLLRPPSTPQPSVERDRSTKAAPQQITARPVTPHSSDAEASTTPFSGPGVKQELQRLADHNSAGSRPRRPPTQFGYFPSISEDDLDPDFAYLGNYDDNDDPDLPEDFEILLHEFEPPAWKEDNQCFETTPELESSNPFANGFSLTPDHSSWEPFKSQQKMHPNHKDAGFYGIPGAYLGCKPAETPNIYLHRLFVPADVLFNKASLSDPDTLTWEEAMKESPENVAKWLTAANKEIKALEEKEIWEEAPLLSATVKVIPGTWVFRRKRDPQGSITKWKA